MKNFNYKKINSLLIKTGNIVNSANIEASDKNINDIVTSVDIKVEKFLIKKITQIYPNSKFIAEETSYNENIENEFVWVIDPIDGTYNFANKINKFAIQIALMINKETIYSAIYNPVSRELFYAVKDLGCFYNNKKTIIKQNINLKRAIITLPDFKSNKDHLDKLFLQVNKHVARIHINSSAAYDFSLLAKGSTDAHIIYIKHIWDYLPGKFLCEMAGAVFEEILFEDVTLLIASSNKLILNNLVNALKDL